MKIIVKMMEKEKEGEDEWIAFSVHAHESYHRVNEEREAKFVMGFEKGKKSRTRDTLEQRERKGFLFRSLTSHSLQCHKV